jgi:hypothetical protein
MARAKLAAPGMCNPADDTVARGQARRQHNMLNAGCGTRSRTSRNGASGEAKNT